MNKTRQKVLILSTGGSAEPLVTAINKHCPNYVIFFCSETIGTQAGSSIMVDGNGEPCKIPGGTRPPEVSKLEKVCRQCGSRYFQTMPSIVKQVGLGAEYESYEKVITSNADSLAECYNRGREAIRIAREKYPHAQLIIDYTGGTKTMSVGLAMAGIDDGVAEMYIVSGPRGDLIKVASGMENIRKVDQTPLLSWQRSKKQMEQLFGKFNYEGCLRIIDEMSPTVSSGTSEDKYLQFYQLLCKALQAWNRFMHYEAAEYLKPYAGDVPQLNAFLSNIIKSKQDYEKQSLAARAQGDPLPQGVKINLSLVYDLLRNAERCLLKEQEVDAVGRIYRALELMAQLCLLHQNPPINTSGVEVEILPSKLQDKYQKLLDLQANNKRADTERRLQLPLFKAYGLLADLGHPLGRLFQEREKEMENLLKIRNNAIIAHGINPVQAHEARAFYDFTCKFLEDGEKDMNVKGSYSKTLQFPQLLPSLRK
ncbi:TIGR02710 family CRISPR-associated CARF protein [Syntrophomonas wolfei]|uniref:TIGR02710 family CRISPR-associated CARF protein n=1 Tax=Syntrophomonas wolfei TaxID=863 RepID=UPI0023F0DBC6|nr:TIGR02710 family CRISPR-associated CARF protein [Syntrophomonas wolfei]